MRGWIGWAARIIRRRGERLRRGGANPPARSGFSLHQASQAPAPFSKGANFRVHRDGIASPPPCHCTPSPSSPFEKEGPGGFALTRSPQTNAA
ncbi:hypothetical protein [Lysobacter gummosus]|uniref:hypothetical protein n=1 Tax=Lysobacter gummosus TaxID=262324 RepID=UPI0036320DFC